MSSPRIEQVCKLLELPESAVPVCLMSVGYPVESWEAGRQTRKKALIDRLSEMKHCAPFKKNPEVEEELKREGLIQEQAPPPWRDAELAYLRDELGLEAQVAVPQFGPPAQQGQQ